jgi:hypothetical protein
MEATLQGNAEADSSSLAAEKIRNPLVPLRVQQLQSACAFCKTRKIKVRYWEEDGPL